MVSIRLSLMKNFFKRWIMKNILLNRTFIKMYSPIERGKRTSLSRQYLRGSGIEIGALHCPLLVPSDVRVKYLDRLSVRELRLQYPELKEYPLVGVDIIDNGERLEKVQSDSLDFVIANHLLEHCENPIRAIESFLRVLKKGGILFLTVPDKRATLDAERPVTPLEHIVKDYKQGPDQSRKEHFCEWATFVDKKERNEVEKHAERLIHNSYSIHFHVWTYLELFELMIYLKRYLNFDFDVKEFAFTGSEGIFIIEKSSIKNYK
ncbi:MAG: hypothetical protein DDT40_01028 [candidate division WS2 bacterium]|nr:hypothetical protein [Candidatus Psychracetigena formicireducens]